MLLAFERAESEEDAAAKREAWLTIVVVGGGPTGVELAGALAELARTGLEKSTGQSIRPQREVILVQSAPRVLPAFSPVLSAHAERSLRDLGVDVRTDARVTHIDEDGVEIDGLRVAARTSFWAAGVAASPAAKWLGLAGDKSGRVVVDGNLAVCGCPGVFAIGDTGGLRTGGRGAGVLGLAPAAKQQGRHAADVRHSAIENQSVAPRRWYHHYGNLATIGLRRRCRSALASVVGRPTWWLWGLAHVVTTGEQAQPRHRRAELALGLLHSQTAEPGEHRNRDGRLSPGVPEPWGCLTLGSGRPMRNHFSFNSRLFSYFVPSKTTNWVRAPPG